jgi:hypothetical protein
MIEVAVLTAWAAVSLVVTTVVVGCVAVLFGFGSDARIDRFKRSS